MKYAKIDSNNIVIGLEIADEMWVSEWNSNKENSNITYIDAKDDLTPGGAMMGASYDSTVEMFIPKIPEKDSDWYFDREKWSWRSPEREAALAAELAALEEEANSASVASGEDSIVEENIEE